MNSKSDLETDKPISLKIISLGSEGEGIGRIDSLAVFVEGALPGETAAVKITERKSNYARGIATKIEETSSQRVTPPCPYFQNCGGCQIMHLNYESQLLAKQQRVAETLKRLGGIKNTEVLPCLPSPKQFGYRNKITLKVKKIQEQTKIGYFERRSHAIVDIDRCAIQDDAAHSILKALRELIGAIKIDPRELEQIIIRSSAKEGKFLIILEGEKCFGKALQELAGQLVKRCPDVKGVVRYSSHKGSYETLIGVPFLEESLMGMTFKISPASFFQVNTLQMARLYEKVLDFAEIDASKTVLDCYCGIGTLSLIAAAKAQKVYGIESVKQAIVDAKENARTNAVRNCQFECGKTEELIGNYSDADVVILNPPRQGCDKSVIQALGKARPKRIVYVSCDPATLARDLSLLQTFGYRIDRIQPVDMFPQTMHVETVVKIDLD